MPISPQAKVGFHYDFFRQRARSGEKIEFPTSHARKIQHAIANSIPSVHIEERVYKNSELNLHKSKGGQNNVTIDIDVRADYTLATTYDAMVSMDHLPDEHLHAFSNIGDNFLHHCPPYGTSDMKVNSLLVGSSRLHERYPKPHVVSQFFVSSKSAKQINSFSLLRRIIGIQEITSSHETYQSKANLRSRKCYEYQTEPIHPFELFSDFKLEQAVPHAPSLTSFSINPDFPLKSCRDYLSDGDSNGEVAYGWTWFGSICASYTKLLPGKIKISKCQL